MLKEQFIQQTLTNPRGQLTEEVASSIHETNRVPDPYIYLVRNHRLVTPTGLIIGNKVEKESYLGQIEYAAFKEIERWADINNSGTVIWFSPPYPGVCPVSKIIISELSTDNNTKILFNRAVVLDINGQTLMELANKLSTEEGLIPDSETLRACPFFPTAEEFINWFELLKLYSKLIENDEDIIFKFRTLQRLSEETFAIAGPNTLYADLYQKADESGLIGHLPGSCPSTTGFTSFEQMLSNSLKINEGHTLDCVCPHCKQRVKASISNGKIHCPNCQHTALYRC